MWIYPNKAAESFHGNYIEYDNDGDTYFYELWLEEYLEKIREQFENTVDELKNTSFSWKIYLT